MFEREYGRLEVIDLKSGKGNEPFWKSRRMQGLLLTVLGTILMTALPDKSAMIGEVIGTFANVFGISLVGASWAKPK